jgi:hypothetical protein
MLVRKKLYVPGLQILAGCAFGLMFLAAIALRVSLYHIETSDYTVFLSQWYNFISTHGGFAALKYNFSNYNTPYRKRDRKPPSFMRGRNGRSFWGVMGQEYRLGHPRPETHQPPAAPVPRGRAPLAQTAHANAPSVALSDTNWFFSSLFPLDYTTYIVVY